MPGRWVYNAKSSGLYKQYLLTLQLLSDLDASTIDVVGVTLAGEELILGNRGLE